jgi:hypothetical protein
MRSLDGRGLRRAAADWLMYTAYRVVSSGRPGEPALAHVTRAIDGGRLIAGV